MDGGKDSIPVETSVPDELERVRCENRLLREQLSQMVLIKQESLQLSYRLDQEAARFDTMQSFIQRSILVDDPRVLGGIICETVIDLLECGISLLWCFNSPQQCGQCFYQNGLGDVPEELWNEMAEWVEKIRLRWFLAPHGWRRDLPPLPAALGVKDDFLVEMVLDAADQPQGILVACNTVHQARFHESFLHSAETVFRTFAKQAGVLVVNLKGRSTIVEQIERIRISEARLSTALVASNVGLWDWNVETDRVYYSDQWKSQLGLAPDEVGDGLDEWSSRLHPEDLERALETTLRCKMVPGGTFELTLRMRCKNGRWRWINCRGYSMTDRSGRVHRMIGTHIDVTDAKSLEKKLLKAEKKQRKAKEQAERESRAKSSFLAAVSHEMRTPLNGVLGAFQMLRMAPDVEDREDLVRMGESSGRWMLKIIGESLDITRIESGKIELRPEAVDLREMVRELKGMRMESTLDRELDFQWEICEDLPARVMVDGGRLKQVLTNLITNAFKFTREGFVRVTLEAQRESRAGQWRVQFTVEDSGIGFSKEFKRVIFQPFTQAIKRSESSEHGIGMGLVISKELTRLMGGTIQAASKRGVGSRFVVSLPLTEPEDFEVVPPIVCGREEVRFRGKVLLAEDDEVSATLGKMMIESLGLVVEIARDGGQALAMAAATRYDLILMDCWMPVMSGLEVVRKLRAMPGAASESVPVVALTANARVTDAAECREAGMEDFMTKPLILSNLVEKLRKNMEAGARPPGGSTEYEAH